MITVKRAGPAVRTLDRYAIRAKVESGLVEDGDPYGFVDVYEGDILSYRSESRPDRAGRLRASLARVEDARQAGVDLFDVFDSVDQQLHECWDALFDPATSDFKATLHLGQPPSNVLFLDLIEVFPGHRGHCLGLAVANRLIEMFGGGCAVVACKPFPLQFDSKTKNEASFGPPTRLKDFSQDIGIATRRIRKHWGKLGFARIGRTSIFAISLSKQRPKIEEICNSHPL